MSLTIATSVSSGRRLIRGRDWLLSRGSHEELLIVGNSADAAGNLARDSVAEKGVAFGWHRLGWNQLIHATALPLLSERGLVPISRVGADALVAGLIERHREKRSLGRYSAAAETPGFRRAIGSVLDELRMGRVTADIVERVAPDLAPLVSGYEAALAEGGYCDRPLVLKLACEGARTEPSQLTRLPTLLLDVAIGSVAEIEFAQALVGRSREVLALVPSSDITTLQFLRGSIECDNLDLDTTSSTEPVSGGLSRLQRNLFRDATEDEAGASEEVEIFSAPGEGRECVEIVRRILALAAEGTPFDSIAILLRSPADYRAHLEEALARAGVPSHFARGARRPDPAGRAFVALLECAAENLSARRFAEYLSLSQLPDAAEDGSPPSAPDRDQLWTAPDFEDRLSENDQDDFQSLPSAAATQTAGKGTMSGEGPAIEAPPGNRQLRTPRRWERLLVDAAVVGGTDRWRRRLTGLMNQVRLDIEHGELDDGQITARRRTICDLKALSVFAMPLIEDLASLPRSAKWGQWLEQLAALAARALKQPDRVLAVLAEMAPMAAVGPVGIAEVLSLLRELLLETSRSGDRQRYGRIFVAPVTAARGMSFDAVFVPGLAERKFPRKIVEEPILLDGLRKQIDDRLATNQNRLDDERLALAVAVDSATRRIFLSYPRLDLDHARGQVPSFYALEVIRSAEGRLPDFAELARRAEENASGRLGWPAPATAEAAIDDAEYDLAVLSGLMNSPDAEAGRARYLLDANPHLARALRARYQRWGNNWTAADGLLRAGKAGRASLSSHRIGVRSYSPTALQHYAACPYRFLLRAIHGLIPREVPASLDELDPLQRGSLIHDIHFTLMDRLKTTGLLPITPANLERAQVLLAKVVDEVGAEYYDLLAPAIDRVWNDEIASIRTDLRELLRRASVDASGFLPTHFELSFGLSATGSVRHRSDANSTSAPVMLDAGLMLRGSVDLVERHPSGLLRVTDHKTGRVAASDGQVIAGGRTLQPVLYALVVEKLFPGDDKVTGGRLYYSTSRGGFAEVMVPLDDQARMAAAQVASTIGGAIAAPFLPASPSEGECQKCDYRMVCGPYEEFRTARKPKGPLAPLTNLRGTA